MTTYGVMQARIANEIARTDLTTEIKEAIQTSIAKYESTRYYFNNKVESTFSTVVDQEYYTSSALSDIPDISEILSMTVAVNGVDRPISQRDHVQIDQLQSGAIKGIPYHYSYAQQKLRLYPIPNAVMTVTMAYIYRFTALSLDADTNAWMTEGEELIRCCAKSELYEHVIRNPAMADRMYARAAAAEKALLTETSQRMDSRMIYSDAPVRHGIYDIVGDR